MASFDNDIYRKCQSPKFSQQSAQAQRLKSRHLPRFLAIENTDFFSSKIAKTQVTNCSNRFWNCFWHPQLLLQPFWGLNQSQKTQNWPRSTWGKQSLRYPRPFSSTSSWCPFPPISSCAHAPLVRRFESFGMQKKKPTDSPAAWKKQNLIGFLVGFCIQLHGISDLTWSPSLKGCPTASRFTWGTGNDATGLGRIIIIPTLSPVSYRFFFFFKYIYIFIYFKYHLMITFDDQISIDFNLHSILILFAVKNRAVQHKDNCPVLKQMRPSVALVVTPWGIGGSNLWNWILATNWGLLLLFLLFVSGPA